MNGKILFFHHLPQFAGGAVIQAPGRFIQEQDLRVMDERAHELKLPLHPRRIGIETFILIGHLEETEKILLQIDLDRYISEREIFETKNLARVVSYIEKRAKEQELGFDVVLSLHKMLLSNIRDEIAGRFREADGRLDRIKRMHLASESPKQHAIA